MKKKFLSIMLAITMIGTPVYGAEFSDKKESYSLNNGDTVHGLAVKKRL